MAGLVVNLETRKGQAGKYRPTGESVEVEDMLPTPERLAELYIPSDLLPPVPPCHPTGKNVANQQPSGGTTGGNGICHRVEPQAVANRSATTIATAETPEKLPNTEARWHGGNGGKESESAKVADPDGPSTYLGEEAEADPFDIPLPHGFDRRRSAMLRDSTE